MSARVGLSLIGTPDGFEAASIGASKPVNTGHKVDLDNSLINILPNTDILVVRRDVEGPRLLTYITYYRFAKEIKNSRTGSFYGGSALFDGFVPDRIQFVFNLLKELAATVARACIDESENKFHSHIESSLLEGFKDDPALLNPTTYVRSGARSQRKMYDRRCFLSLDESVPDYERFLYETLLGDPDKPTSLPSYRFVYTSPYELVIDEVRLRRGLKIETLDSLRKQYLRESADHEEVQSVQPRTKTAEHAPYGLPPANTHAHDPAHDAEARGDVSSKKLARVVNEEPPHTIRQGQRTGEGAQAQADAVNQGGKNSRVVIEIDSVPPRRENVEDDDADNASLGALARQFRRTYRANRGLVLLAVIILGGILGALIILPLLTKAWSYVTGRAGTRPEGTIYYDGCRKLPGSIDDIPTPKKCQPQNVASAFLTQLKSCTPYNNHLNTLGGKDSRTAYTDSIEKQITDSLSYPSLRNTITGKSDAASLSRKASTGFLVDLNFPGGDLCLNQILNDPESEFTKVPTFPPPPPTPVPEVSTQNNRPPPLVQSTQHTPAPTTSRTATPTPMKSPTPSSTPAVSPPPPQNDADNKNSSGLTGSMLGNDNSTTGTKPKPTPTPSQPNNSNKQPTAQSRQNRQNQQNIKKGKKAQGEEKRPPE